MYTFDVVASFSPGYGLIFDEVVKSDGPLAMTIHPP
jgi:hypothetical protein